MNALYDKEYFNDAKFTWFELPSLPKFDLSWLQISSFEINNNDLDNDQYSNEDDNESTVSDLFNIFRLPNLAHWSMVELKLQAVSTLPFVGLCLFQLVLGVPYGLFFRRNIDRI